MVNPAGAVALLAAVNHPLIINMKVKGVIGLAGVMRVAAQGFFPGNTLAQVLNNAHLSGDVLQGEYPFAMHARATHLNTPLSLAGACLA